MLAARYGASQGTVRKAIAALAAENLVVRRQGKGTFVATHTEEKSSLFRFLRIRRNDDVDEYPGSRVIDVRRGKASAEAARLLDLKPGDPVILLRRVLEYCGRAGHPRRDHAAGGALQGTDQGAGRRLPGLDVQLFRDAVRRADAEGAGKAPRGAGGCRRAPGSSACESGDPLLAVDRVTLTYGDRPVEWRRGLCATKRHHYFNEIG